MLGNDDDYQDWIAEHNLDKLTVKLALAPWGCLLLFIAGIIVLGLLGILHS